MAKCGVLENLLLKDHLHTFINKGGDVRALDFRFNIAGRKIGAPFHGTRIFLVALFVGLFQCALLGVWTWVPVPICRDLEQCTIERKHRWRLGYSY